MAKEIVLIADEAYCLMIEAKLRTLENIGWNITKGGGKPPKFDTTGFVRTEEVKKKISLTKTGKTRSEEEKAKIVPALLKNGAATRFAKGYTPWNKGLKWKHKINRQGESNG